MSLPAEFGTDYAGVGVFAVQLARIAGARVLGTGSPSTAEHRRSLLGRIRDRDAGTVTAALDLHGADTVQEAPLSHRF